MKLAAISCLVWTIISAQSTYILGDQGQNCWDACFNQGMNCNPSVQTDNNITLFQQLGIQCTPDKNPWWAEFQPSFVSNKTSADYGKCQGFIDVPNGVHCSARDSSVRRLCRCDAPKKKQFFSTGCAGCTVGPEEKTFFAHHLIKGDYGVLTHMWTTYVSSSDNGMIFRYYIDGETTPSITYTPSLASGVGFYDSTAPWGTQWIGKGAADGGWYNNFRVPFQKNFRVTVQHIGSDIGEFYVILRGATNLPIIIGGRALPSTARLNQFIVNATFAPLEFITLADVKSGSGVHWMHTLQVNSGNLNFLEGCYHVFTDDDREFPGTLLSTGTEDYFDSGWYFNAGEFQLPVSGFTHFSLTKTGLTWSAYRFHDQDPLFFDNGFRLVWRNGDVLDPAGIKCLSIKGIVVGNPTPSDITAYSWVYTW